MNATCEHVNLDGDHAANKPENVDGGTTSTIHREFEVPGLTRKDGVAAQPMLTSIRAVVVSGIGKHEEIHGDAVFGKF